MSTTRFLTGITTTGTPHLGNFVGSIRPSVAASLRPGVQSFYFLADYHALIKCEDPARIQRSTLEIAASWLAADILHDVGHSINPAIDIGQIEGGFVQGMGWLTTEQLVWNDKGYLATHAPSTYKIPATGDIPSHFKIDLWPEANREDNVVGSQAVCEPPFILANSVYEALRNAVAAGRGGVDAAASLAASDPRLCRLPPTHLCAAGH